MIGRNGSGGIDKSTNISVLFVCTGNTCRSPMAEATAAEFARAAHVLDPKVVITVSSAGTTADNGEAMSPGAAAALREMGVVSVGHRSRSLSRRQIAEADVIFAMTSAHLAAVVALDRDSRDRAFTLDPTGADVPDPIGADQATYSRTAQRIKALVDLRLKELLS